MALEKNDQRFSFNVHFKREKKKTKNNPLFSVPRSTLNPDSRHPRERFKTSHKLIYNSILAIWPHPKQSSFYDDFFPSCVLRHVNLQKLKLNAITYSSTTALLVVGLVSFLRMFWHSITTICTSILFSLLVHITKLARSTVVSIHFASIIELQLYICIYGHWT